MNSNAENRNKTRFAHESKVTLESNEIGFQRGARMYNFDSWAKRVLFLFSAFEFI